MFCPLKSSGIVSRDTISDGDYAASGEASIRRQARRVTPASNVTVGMKVKTNTGTATAAGVVSGAWLGQSGGSSAEVGAKCRSGGVWPK